MIEVVACPPNLGDWEPCGNQPYFELYGEARPLLCTDRTEILPAGTADAVPQSATATPIYEYYWTLGLPEGWASHRAVAPLDRLPSQHATDYAQVCLFFPLDGGWRASEVVTTVRYCGR